MHYIFRVSLCIGNLSNLDHGTCSKENLATPPWRLSILSLIR